MGIVLSRCVCVCVCVYKFAMDAMTRKSHGGFINFVNNGAVSWKSGLQSIVTLSSCEAEYVALYSVVCEVKYLRSLMRELGHRQEDSTLILGG